MNLFKENLKTYHNYTKKVEIHGEILWYFD